MNIKQYLKIVFSLQFKTNSLTNPKTVTIIGCSSKRLNPANILFNKYQQIKDIKVSKSQPKQIQSGQDLVIISINEKQVPQCLQTLISQQLPKSIQIITSGFEECNNNSLSEYLTLFRYLDIPVQGTNCVGNILDNRDFTFMKSVKLNQNNINKSQTSIVSSSGAFMVSISENIPVQYGFSIGNQSQLKIYDYIKFLLKDKQIKNIIIYADSLTQNEFEQLLQMMKNNSQKQFYLYIGSQNKQSQQAANEHNGSQSQSISYQLVKQKCKGIKNINISNNIQQISNNIKVDNFIQNHNNIAALCQSGYIKTSLSRILPKQKLNTQDLDEEFSQLFKSRNAKTQFKQITDITPQLNNYDYFVMVERLLQRGNSVIVSLLPQLFNEKENEEFIDYMNQLIDFYKDKLFFIIENRSDLYDKLKTEQKILNADNFSNSKQFD